MVPDQLQFVLCIDRKAIRRLPEASGPAPGVSALAIAAMASCQTAALRTIAPGSREFRCRQSPRRPAAAVRAGPPPQEQRDAEPAEAVAVPAVGWLWDKKSADTKKRLQQQNIRPKK